MKKLHCYTDDKKNFLKSKMQKINIRNEKWLQQNLIYIRVFNIKKISQSNITPLLL